MSDKSKENVTEFNVHVDTDKLKSELKHLAELELENKTLKENLEAKENEKQELEYKLSNSKGVGAGVIPLSLNVKNKDDSNIIECSDRLDFLLKVREKNPEAYKQIKEKAFRGLQDTKQSFEVKDTWENSKSIIRRILDEQNKQYRKKFGHEE